MKKGNVRTSRHYEIIKGKRKIRFAIQIKVKGIWRQAMNAKKKLYIYDLEYDACAKLLSLFEKRYERELINNVSLQS